MDAASWSRLVGTFGPIVYRWTRTSGVDQNDAADVVQDVFASVSRGIPDFQRQKEQGSFRSWLATITRNRVRDHFRRVAKHEAAEGGARGGTDGLQNLQQQADDLDSTICPSSIETPIVRQVMASVESEFETVTWLAFWRNTVDGIPASDVAKELSLSIASVYQAKSRVLRRLRVCLGELPS